MALNTSTIRPGLLVALKTSIKGNTSYAKTTIESDHIVDSGARVARWETTRRIADPDEHARSAEVRSKARSLVSSVCSYSSFGLICPESRSADLAAVVEDARKLVAEFNAKASLSYVEFNILTGKIEQDDVAAVRAINSDIRDLLSRMEDGLANLDVDAVRKAANSAKNMAQTLSPAAQTRVQEAIDTARAAARQIVKAGETIAPEIDTQAIQEIARARTAFLDIEGVPADIAAPTVEGRGIDLIPELTPEQEAEHDRETVARGEDEAQQALAASAPELEV